MVNAHSLLALAQLTTGSIGIIAALPEEAAVLTRKKLQKGECCRLAENSHLALSGAGAANAAAAAESLIAQGATLLISWGCAAGLAADVNPGDLVLAASVLSATGEEYLADQSALAALRAQLPAGLTVNQGAILESRVIVALSRDKLNLQQQTGAVALDMESAAVFAAAAQANLPCIAVRAIADPLGLNLPSAVATALNADGQIVFSRLFTDLVQRPWQIPALIKLGLNFNAAVKTLKQVAVGLTDGLTGQVSQEN